MGEFVKQKRNIEKVDECAGGWAKEEGWKKEVRKNGEQVCGVRRREVEEDGRMRVEE